MVYQWMDKIARTLQSECLLCNKPLKNKECRDFFGLCKHCSLHLQLHTPRCRYCAIALPQAGVCGQCLQHQPRYDCSYCAISYQDNHRLVAQLKAHSIAYTRLSADLLCHSLPQHCDIDGLIAVPMYYKKWLQRGNNHCDLLAKQLSRQLAIPYISKAIVQQRETQPQKSLNAKRRRHNLHAAFRLNTNVKNKRIALIDDVITTTATMNELAKLLQNAGAEHVEAWAVARTEKSHFH
jgi:ComF family protein